MSERKTKHIQRVVDKRAGRHIVDFLTYVNEQPLRHRIAFAWRIIRGK
jgi:hypothetical protein